MANAHDNVVLDATWKLRVDQWRAEPDPTIQGGPNVTVSLCDGLAFDLSWWETPTVSEIWVPSGGGWVHVADVPEAADVAPLDQLTAGGTWGQHYRLAGNPNALIARTVPVWRLPWNLRLAPAKWMNELGSQSWYDGFGFPHTIYPACDLVQYGQQGLVVAPYAGIGEWQTHRLQWWRTLLAGGVQERLVWTVDGTVVVDAAVDSADMLASMGGPTEAGWFGQHSNDAKDCRIHPRDLLGYRCQADNGVDTSDLRQTTHKQNPHSWDVDPYSASSDDWMLAWARPRPRITVDRADVTLAYIGLAVNGVQRYLHDRESRWTENTSGRGYHGETEPPRQRGSSDGPYILRAEDGLTIPAEAVEATPWVDCESTSATHGPLAGANAYGHREPAATWPRHVATDDVRLALTGRWWYDPTGTVTGWRAPGLGGGTYQTLVDALPHQVAVSAAPSYPHGPYLWTPRRFDGSWPLTRTYSGQTVVNRLVDVLPAVPDPNQWLTPPYPPGVPYQLPHVASEGVDASDPSPAGGMRNWQPSSLVALRNGRWGHSRRATDPLIDVALGTWFTDSYPTADSFTRLPAEPTAPTSLYDDDPTSRPRAADWRICVDRADDSLHLAGLREDLVAADGGPTLTVTVWRQAVNERDPSMPGFAAVDDLLTLPALAGDETGWYLADACLSRHGTLFVFLWRCHKSGAVTPTIIRQARYDAAAEVVYTGTLQSPPVHLRAAFAADPASGEVQAWWLPPGGDFTVISCGSGVLREYVVPCPPVPDPPYGEWLACTAPQWRLLWPFVTASGRARVRCAFEGWYDSRGTFPPGFEPDLATDDDFGCFGVFDFLDICDLTSPGDALLGAELTVEVPA